MKATLLAATMAARFNEHRKGVRIRPALIEGPPGVGKTQIIGQVAADLGVGYHALHAPLMPVEDFGMPDLSGDSVVFKVPDYKFPFEGSSHFQDEGIIAVDEVAQCDSDQQKVWANLFQERELHGRKLKPGWMIVATGNRLEDRAGANRILSHFNDRFTTYAFDVNVDDWSLWALQKGGVRPEVVSFIRFRPDLLIQFDPAKPKSPTPRAWSEGVSPIIDVVAPEALFDTVKGDVGEGPAGEFTGFLETYRSLPDPDLVIARADNHAVPTEAHVLYALSGALSHRAKPENFKAIITFACRMPMEFMVLTVKDCIRRKPELQETKEFLNWCMNEGHDALA